MCGDPGFFSGGMCHGRNETYLMDDIKNFFKRAQDRGRLKSRKDIRIYSKHHTAYYDD